MLMITWSRHIWTTCAAFLHYAERSRSVFFVIRKLRSSWLRYVAVLCLPDLSQLWYTVWSKSLFGAVWEVFIAGRLIGRLHGSAVTNKGCLNCASILLFQCTNRQWEARRGHTYRQMHVKLQSTLKCQAVFYQGRDKGAELFALPSNCDPVSFQCVILASCGLLM